MQSIEHDVEILNDLIQVTLDSARGYEEAASDAKNPGFKAVFGRHAMRRKELSGHLQSEVSRLLGSRPASRGTAAGAVHRTFMNLKNALTGSDTTLVESVEAAEDYLKDRYEQALKDAEVSLPIHALISNSFTEVKIGHDEMRDLKHSLKN